MKFKIWSFVLIGLVCSFPVWAFDAPSSLIVPATDPDGGYVVSWSPLESKDVTYTLEESTSSDFSANKRLVYVGTKTKANIKGAWAGNTYYYRVKATLSGVDSEWTTSSGCDVPVMVRVKSVKAGSVTPSGIVTIPVGETTVFSVVPSEGYHTTSVRVDGKELGAVTQVVAPGDLVMGPKNKHSIATKFAINTYNVTAMAGTGGKISPAGTKTIKHGKIVPFTLAPHDGWKIESVLIDGIVQPGFPISGIHKLQTTVKGNTVVEAFFTPASEMPNVAPTANAGPDQSQSTSSTASLSGSGTDLNGDTITYRWSFISRPVGSTSMLSDSSVQNPTFTLDKDGAYVLGLTVNDSKIDSQVDIVTITAMTINSAPIANAGPDQEVLTGSVVSLSGSGVDSDGNNLSHRWTISSKPIGSTASIMNESSKTPTFTADRDGIYVINLVVSDQATDSIADSIVITSLNYFSQLADAYDGITNGGPFGKESTTIIVSLVGSTLTIRDEAFFSGTCIYTATVPGQGTEISNGTFQCSDFTNGNWTLKQAKIVDAKDIYISLNKNGTENKWMYGMSDKASSYISPFFAENLSNFNGAYEGISNNSNFTTDDSDLTISASATSLTITDVGFFSGTCIYTATILEDYKSTTNSYYQCSDFSSGTWELRQIKKVEDNDIYISILKDGSKTTRVYAKK